MKDQNKLQQRQEENKQKIIDATVKLIQKKGVDAITVRNVCTAAGISTGNFYYYFKNKDELLLSFIMESFDQVDLQSPDTDLAGRVTELFLILVEKYMSFGKDFMKSFYTPSNTALQAYMSEVDGKFLPGTVMGRCEAELVTAYELGVLKSSDFHGIASDICTIVKGAIFEYSLSARDYDLRSSIQRLIKIFLAYYTV